MREEDGIGVMGTLAQTCETCYGKGQNPAWPLAVCPTCDGTGRAHGVPGALNEQGGKP